MHERFDGVFDVAGRRSVLLIVEGALVSQFAFAIEDKDVGGDASAKGAGRVWEKHAGGPLCCVPGLKVVT